MSEAALTVTDAAFQRLRDIVAAEPTQGRWLRLAVLGGGCSGFQYKFELEAAPQAEDWTLERQDVGVMVDPVSAPLLAGAVLDYKKEIIGARFVVENPNATSSCGCGVSFSL